ncbi:hypothetical protein OH76DRAFT_1423493 [Lentinus brumalis]|uniref:Uncharacterized protein n=1 Tax=Lentinus brumalis TaxID=2498619 RepID=A0A371CKK2_9APHY|nr:hypothetical protein OH76DRAFT_1423493 [Polyporus brumalis]
MVSHPTHEPLSPSTRSHRHQGQGQEAARVVPPTSGMAAETDHEEDEEFLSASESPDTTPPPTPVATPVVYDRNQRRVRGQTIVNITVNATTAPVTVQTGDLPPTPPVAPPLASPVRRDTTNAATVRSPRSARGSHPSAAYYASPSTPSTPRRRAHGPDYDRLPLPTPPRPVPSRTAARTDTEAANRRMREIERALEEFRLEQAHRQDTGDTRMSAERAATEGAAVGPSIIDPADEHIDPPEIGRRKWYVAIVGSKVGIFKHYPELARYTAYRCVDSGTQNMPDLRTKDSYLPNRMDRGIRMVVPIAADRTAAKY